VRRSKRRSGMYIALKWQLSPTLGDGHEFDRYIAPPAPIANTIISAQL